jgi:hypothetical protein
MDDRMDLMCGQERLFMGDRMDGCEQKTQLSMDEKMDEK